MLLPQPLHRYLEPAAPAIKSKRARQISQLERRDTADRSGSASGAEDREPGRDGGGGGRLMRNASLGNGEWRQFMAARKGEGSERDGSAKVTGTRGAANESPHGWRTSGEGASCGGTCVA